MTSWRFIDIHVSFQEKLSQPSLIARAVVDGREWAAFAGKPISQLLSNFSAAEWEIVSVIGQDNWSIFYLQRETVKPEDYHAPVVPNQE